MANNTAVGPTTFVLGQESRGNREIRTYGNGDLYSVDASTNTAYSQQTTRFPYTGA